MKKRNKRVHGFYGCAKGLLLPIKLTFITFFLGIMSLNASSVYPRREKLSLDLKTAFISDALKSIEDQSEFVFIYEDKVLDSDKKVSLQVKEATIDRILSKIFEGTDITYEIHEKQVILTKEPERRLEPVMQVLKEEEKAPKKRS
jgi:hypothetical protein